MVKAVLGQFGRVDILVNNAGIVIVKPAEEMTEGDWDKVIDVNLKGMFLCAREIGKVMIKQGGGTIVNIGSMAGLAGALNRLAYSVSKGGVHTLTKGLAIEWAKYGIRVNCIAPGYVKTDIYISRFKNGLLKEEDIAEKIPIRRLADPEEIARIAVFLASEESSYMTGAIVVVDGGFTSFGYG
jgi:NAD(P)-dependent dehydrogenase (short-subunit alcohol dehydrogenase family)